MLIDSSLKRNSNFGFDIFFFFGLGSLGVSLNPIL
jgi:hypothetical protein